MSTRIDIVHVPYKGGGPAVADLVGGKVDMLFTGAPVTMSHIKSGRLKVLAVTDSQRSAALPDTPTMAESVRATSSTTGTASWRRPARRGR